MGKYEEAAAIMAERFAGDSLIAVATFDGERVHNRVVDAFYCDGAFYVSTGARSNKMLQAEAHPDVAVCAIDWFSGHGTARNLGWVMDPKNAALRDKIRRVFEWFDEVGDEQNPNSIILEIRLIDGIIIKDHNAVRYRVDFANKSAQISENGGEFI